MTSLKGWFDRVLQKHHGGSFPEEELDDYYTPEYRNQPRKDLVPESEEDEQDGS